MPRRRINKHSNRYKFIGLGVVFLFALGIFAIASPFSTYFQSGQMTFGGSIVSLKAENGFWYSSKGDTIVNGITSAGSTEDAVTAYYSSQTFNTAPNPCLAKDTLYPKINAAMAIGGYFVKVGMQDVLVSENQDIQIYSSYKNAGFEYTTYKIKMNFAISLTDTDRFTVQNKYAYTASNNAKALGSDGLGSLVVPDFKTINNIVLNVVLNADSKDTNSWIIIKDVTYIPSSLVHGFTDVVTNSFISTDVTSELYPVWEAGSITGYAAKEAVLTAAIPTSTDYNTANIEMDISSLKIGGIYIASSDSWSTKVPKVMFSYEVTLETRCNEYGTPKLGWLSSWVMNNIDPSKNSPIFPWIIAIVFIILVICGYCGAKEVQSVSAGHGLTNPLPGVSALWESEEAKKRLSHQASLEKDNTARQRQVEERKRASRYGSSGLGPNEQI
jgi:hypothetical protein